MSTEEEVYMATSLDFINTYKKYFTPVLSNIARDLNANNELIEAMNAMKEEIKKKGTNSNLKELITRLLAYGVHSDEIIDYNTDGVIDHAAYVKQTLELMNTKGSKERNYKLLFMVMQDMKANTKLMDLIQNFKQENDEWKKMVGMLIPKGALVKIRENISIIEGVSKSSLSAINNKKTPITSNQLSGTVEERAKLTGNIYGGEFLKIVSLPEDILRHKKYHKKEFKPEEIELYEPKAEGSGEAVTGAPGIVTVPGTPLPAQAPGIVTVTGTVVSEPGGTPETASAPVALAQVGTTETASAQVGTATAQQPATTAPASGATPAPVATATATAQQPATATAQEPATAPAPAPAPTPVASAPAPATATATAQQPATPAPAPAPATAPVDHNDINVERVEGGQQRTTRKHKNSIIGSARKTRTNH